MPRTNKSKFVILGWLSWGPLSGYDIKKKVAKSASKYWREGNGQIYPMLKKLEEGGLVSSILDNKSGGRKRRVYEVSSQGIKVLRNWLLEPVARASYREEMPLKLSFAHLLPAIEVVKQLKTYRQQLVDDRLKMQEESRDFIETPEQQRFVLMSRDWAESVIQTKLDWVERTIKEFEPQAANSPLSRVKEKSA